MTRESIDARIAAGYQARRESRLAEAMTDFNAAIEECRQSRETLRLARALSGLGQIERDLGDTESAAGHYRESVAILRAGGPSLALAHTVRHLGDILRGRGELEDAGAAYREALAIYRADSATPPLDLANALRGYALLRSQAGDNAESIQLWQEAGRLYRLANVDAGVAESIAQIAALSN